MEPFSMFYAHKENLWIFFILLQLLHTVDTVLQFELLI